jgi:hypothetical protein
MPRAFYRALAVTFPDLEPVLSLQQKLQTEHNLFALPSKSCRALLRRTAGGGCPYMGSFLCLRLFIDGSYLIFNVTINLIS